MLAVRDPYREHQDGAVLLPKHLLDAPLQALHPDQAAVNLVRQRNVQARHREGRHQNSAIQEPKAAEQQDCVEPGLAGPLDAGAN